MDGTQARFHSFELYETIKIGRFICVVRFRFISWDGISYVQRGFQRVPNASPIERIGRGSFGVEIVLK